VFHLKRFTYSRYLKNKIDTFVNFPVHDLDLSKYVKNKNGQSYLYELYAVSNHYGGLGGGHYTAYAKVGDFIWSHCIIILIHHIIDLYNIYPLDSCPIVLATRSSVSSLFDHYVSIFMQLIDDNKWYHFDDSHVSSVNESEIRNSAAYVLFYRRVRSETETQTAEMSTDMDYSCLNSHNDKAS